MLLSFVFTSGHPCTYKDEARSLQLELSTIYPSSLTSMGVENERVRDLEAQLQGTTAQYNDAQTILKTYDGIVKRLKVSL